jgi:hypothetical protein
VSTKSTATIALSILLAGIIVAAALAFTHRPGEPHATTAGIGGRYQFAVGTGKANEPYGDMFVLDSQTGRLWARVKENQNLYWKEVKDVPWTGQPTGKVP